MTTIQPKVHQPPRFVDDASKKAGVSIERGALQFEPKAELSQADRVERARVVLEAMRAEGAGSFGGRVSNGVDQAESLRNYYRALDAGRTLITQAPELRAQVEAFLDKVSMPDDLRAALRAAVEPEQQAVAGPLGAVSFARDPDYQNIWNRWQQGDLSVTKMDDASVRHFFGTLRNNLGVGAGHMGYGGMDFRAGIINLYARGKELGQNVPEQFANYLQNANSWGVDDPGVRRALARLARAWGVDPATQHFHGRPLGEGGIAAPAAPRGRPLGKDATYAADPNRKRIQRDFQNGVDCYRAVDDTTIKRLFNEWGLAGHSFDNFYNQGTPQTRVGMVLMFARAKELGLNVQPGNLGTLTSYCEAGPALVSALRRWGRAFGVDVSQAQVGGRPLAQWGQAAQAGPDASSYLQPQLREVGPRGKLELPPDQAYNLSNSADPRMHQISDATLTGWLQSYGENWSNVVQRAHTSEWLTGTIGLFARAVELGNYAGNVHGYLQQLTQGITPDRLGQPETARAIADLLVRTKLRPDQCNHAHGQTLANIPGVAAAFREANELLQGTGAPLPRRRPGGVEPPGPIGDVPSHANAWNARSVDFCRLSDHAIQTELPDAGGLQGWLNNINSAEIFRLFARTAELGAVSGRPAAQQHIAQYLANPVAEHLVTQESMPWLTRMARAGQVPFENVQVIHGGVAIPMMQHPAFAVVSEADAAAVAARLDGLLTALAPGSKLHGAEKEAALIQATFDEQPALEVDELLPKLIEAAAAGKLAPIDLSAAPKAHRRDLVASTLGQIPHVGAQAVIAALTLQLPREDLVALFEARLPPAAAGRLADAVGKLSALEPKALGSVLEGIVRDGRVDLSNVELRTELASKQVDLRRLLGIFRDLSDGQEAFVGTVLTRLAQVPKNSRDAAQLLAFVDRALADVSLDPAALAASLGDEVKAKVITRLRDAVDATAAAAVSAPRELRAVELAKWAIAARRLELLQPNEGGTWALEQLHAADLQGTLPLAEVDAQLGVVAGRVWKQERVVDKGTVDVAGIALPKATRPDRDVDAIPRIEHPLVATDTGTQNLRSIAGRWRTQAPLVLSGPGSGEFAMLVPKLAQLLEAPYVRVPVDASTQPEMLFGPEGLVDQAAKQGKIVHFVAAEPLSEGLLFAMNSFFDGAVAQARKAGGGDPQFRLVVSGPVEEGGPTKLTRFQRVPMNAAGVADLAQAVSTSFPDLPKETVERLAETHAELAEWQTQAGDATAPRFDLARMFSVADRVTRFGDATARPEQQLRAELDLVYLAGFTQAERADAQAILDGLVPALPPRFGADGPQLVRGKGSVTIGDISLPRGDAPSALDVAGPVLTRGTREVLYAMAAAVRADEPIVLRGEAGSGRTTLAQLLASELGRPLGVHLVNNVADAQKVLAASSGQVVLLAGLDEADRGELARLRPPEDGALVLEFASSARGASGAMATLAVDYLEQPAEQAEIAVEHGKRLGLPSAVTEAVTRFHAWATESYASGTLGADQPVEERPSLDRALIFDTLGFVAELTPTMGLGPAFVVAVETYYGATSEADAKAIADKARELSK